MAVAAWSSLGIDDIDTKVDETDGSAFGNFCGVGFGDWLGGLDIDSPSHDYLRLNPY